MKPTILSQFLVAALASVLILVGYTYFAGAKKNVVIEHVDGTPAKSAVFTLDEKGTPVPLDFTVIAEKSVSSVVHILSASGVSRAQNKTQQELLKDFFNGRPQHQGPSVGTGSGVIINSDGYIVTNNHVIKGAEDLEVTLNDKRKFKAKLIGTDPQTDIAVIKIEEKNLPTLTFSNSDQVKVGQWVLAVGNPFNLTSTVTAGIVSAKGRDIQLFDRQTGGIESFIQTDAAINPGNSGGALVDLNGHLIGINTAIASQTGTYAGYGFAVPANLASRVVSDLIQYGSTQRGYLGVTVQNLDGNLAKEAGVNMTEGAFIATVNQNSAAEKAGILPKDIVTSINGKKVSSSTDLIEIVGSHRIGDNMKIKVNRKGQEKEFNVILKNGTGTLASIQQPSTKAEFASQLGADLETLDRRTAEEMGLTGGVVVTNLRPGMLSDNEIEEGFIITRINKKNVTKPEEVIELLRTNTDGALIEGYYPGYQQKQYYGIGPR